ncbi:hypothetical protein M440DRAFT_1206789 [Trichoderma longibrachiatum ATCC 18648]|uniref:Uncharacterized protein n=1 Tax=Trichoderma longibrachiatum ATCC 18648 TaxID=983965 RepID=A0A2T4C6M5_TRILO|nr:hypothetical protein M440DRAFT_1206789 [Trichoderma longibrachiatum ATCC 18648]
MLITKLDNTLTSTTPIPAYIQASTRKAANRQPTQTNSPSNLSLAVIRVQSSPVQYRTAARATVTTLPEAEANGSSRQTSVTTAALKENRSFNRGTAYSAQLGAASFWLQWPRRELTGIQLASPFPSRPNGRRSARVSQLKESLGAFPLRGQLPDSLSN